LGQQRRAKGVQLRNSELEQLLTFAVVRCERLMYPLRRRHGDACRAR
jgi:hypothetical protein